jgi:predicted nucleic acid-binding protein
MVIYWDTSALVTMLARGPAAPKYRAIANQSRIVTWWGTFIECAAGIARRAREGSAPSQIAESYRMLEQLSEEWLEISSNERLRRAALRVTKNYPLRGGDALQLGAALIASDFEPHSARFLTEDARLRQAAEREGFVVD